MENIIEQHEERLREAQLSSDVAMLEDLISDKLQFVFHDGTVYKKSMDIDAHRSRAIRIEVLDFSERVICEFGDVASVTVKAKMKGVFSGQAFQGTFRYGRTWLSQNGRWQIIAGSVSQISE